MSSTISPNMNLVIPTVGQEPGPTWATDLNTSLTIVDSHNHAAGSGVPITPDGLNINTDLTLQSNFLTNAAGVVFIPQLTSPDINTIYESGVDLFYVDGDGNNIQITANGGIAGSPGSIANLVSPASASYVSGSSTFVWQSDTSIAANMDFGAAIMRNLSPNSTFAVTLQPQANLSSNYALTLPALPASQKFMTLDASGAMSAPYTVDGSTIAIDANVIQVPDGGINTAELADNAVTTIKITDANVTTAKLADGAVTPAKTAALGQQISSSSGGFSTTSTSFVNVTSLSVTITTTGRPVFVGIIADSNGSAAKLGASDTSAEEASALFRILRGATEIGRHQLLINASTDADVIINVPASFYTIDLGATAGAHTYVIQAAANSSGDTASVTNARLIAYEL